MDKRYQIVFSGEISNEISQAEARENIAKLFRNSRRLPDFFTGKRHILKRDLDRQTAAHYLDLLQKQGLLCRIEEEIGEEKQNIEPVLEDETITCPNCRAEQVKCDECSKCGIIFGKWNQRLGGDPLTRMPSYGEPSAPAAKRSFDEIGKLCLMVPLLVMLAFCIYKTYGWDQLHYSPGALVTSSPQQTKLWNTKQFEKDGVSYASSDEYSLKARLIKKEGFILDLFRVSDLIVHLGWGPMSDEAILDLAEIQPASIQFSKYPPIPIKFLMTCILKAEIIPASRDVEKFFRNLRVGEIVELRGYLLGAGT